MPQNNSHEQHAAHYSDMLLEISIDAKPAAVWQALTQGVGDWWPGDGYAGGEDGKRAMKLEPEPGGRMYESWEGGGGLLWGHVITIDPEKTLQIAGHTFARWGGPTLWYGSWDLSEQEDGTLLRYSESGMGKVTQDNRAQTEKGWKWLLAGALKAHLEGKPCPPFQD